MKKNMKHALGEKTEYLGKILVSKWGYSMRLVDFVDFYAVVEETDKTLLVEELKSEEKGDGGYLTGHSNPTMVRTGEKFRVYKRERKDSGDKYLVSTFGSSVKKYPLVWDGRPVSFNHCD